MFLYLKTIKAYNFEIVIFIVFFLLYIEHHIYFTIIRNWMYWIIKLFWFIIIWSMLEDWIIFYLTTPLVRYLFHFTSFHFISLTIKILPLPSPPPSSFPSLSLSFSLLIPPLYSFSSFVSFSSFPPFPSVLPSSLSVSLNCPVSVYIFLST